MGLVGEIAGSIGETTLKVRVARAKDDQLKLLGQNPVPALQHQFNPFLRIEAGHHGNQRSARGVLQTKLPL